VFFFLQFSVDDKETSINEVLVWYVDVQEDCQGLIDTNRSKLLRVVALL
jgi:hypothetical protein